LLIELVCVLMFRRTV